MSDDVSYSTVDFSQKNQGNRAADKTSTGKEDDVTYAAVKFGVAPSRQQQQAASSSTAEVLSIAVSNLTMERKQIQYRHSELEKNYSNISEKYSALDQYCPITDTSSKERVCEACPQNWVLFNGKCYYFSTDRMNWNSSRDNCTSMGGHLVIIESEAEQEFIHSQTGRIRDFFWIGLSDEVTEGEFLWVDNTPPSTT
ncbi:UNVERIFIED_CONTAM: hypothetical protein FKN15_070595 [Acipenser sinensis]